MLPYFITVSNIRSKKSQNVIKGNERVLRARLADAQFFYNSDRKIMAGALYTPNNSIQNSLFRYSTFRDGYENILAEEFKQEGNQKT